MIKLKYLMNDAGLSTLDVQKYTGITYSSISRFSTGVGSLNEKHIAVLSSFFGVTSDFLLGLSNYGIDVFEVGSSDVKTITLEEYSRKRVSIKISIINSGTPTIIKTFKNDMMLGGYKVYRDLLEDNNLDDIEKTTLEIVSQLKTFDLDQLTKIDNFIKEYIAK